MVKPFKSNSYTKAKAAKTHDVKDYEETYKWDDKVSNYVLVSRKPADPKSRSLRRQVKAAKPTQDRTNWDALRAMPETEIDRIAAEDEDNPTTDDEHWAQAKVSVKSDQK